MITQICAYDSMDGAGTCKEDVIMFTYFICRWDDLTTYRTNATCLFEDFGQVTSPSLILNM